MVQADGRLYNSEAAGRFDGGAVALWATETEERDFSRPHLHGPVKLPPQLRVEGPTRYRAATAFLLALGQPPVVCALRRLFGRFALVAVTAQQPQIGQLEILAALGGRQIGHLPERHLMVNL